MTGHFLGSIASFDNLLRELKSVRDRLVEHHDLEVESLGHENKQLRRVLALQQYTPSTSAGLPSSQLLSCCRPSLSADTVDSADDDIVRHEPSYEVITEVLYVAAHMQTSQGPDGAPGVSPKASQAVDSPQLVAQPNDDVSPEELYTLCTPRDDVPPEEMHAQPAWRQVKSGGFQDVSLDMPASLLEEADDSMPALLVDMPGGGGAEHSLFADSFPMQSEDSFNICGSVLAGSMKMQTMESSGPPKQSYMREMWAKHADYLKVNIQEVFEGKISKIASSMAVNKGSFLVNQGSFRSRQEHNAAQAKGLEVKSIKSHQRTTTTRIRFGFMIFGLSLLVYDAMAVPIVLCFSLKESPFGLLVNLIMSLLAVSFWALDFCLTVFCMVCRKHEVRKPSCRRIFFDIISTSADFIVIYLNAVGMESPVRALLLFRVLRFYRFRKLKPYVQGVVLRSSQGLNGTFLASMPTVLVIILAHLMACVWHLVGSSLDNGWVHINELQSTTVTHRYMISLRWMVGRLQGTSPIMQANETLEVMFEIFYLAVCFIIVSIYAAIMTYAMMQTSVSDSYKLKITAIQYAKRHDISAVTSRRVFKHLTSQIAIKPNDVLQSESSLLQGLPHVLQQDLKYESRFPKIEGFQFIRDVHPHVPRAVRHLCFEAIVDMFAEEAEVVFAKGDVCNNTLFIVSGRFKYLSHEEMTWKQKGSGGSQRSRVSDWGNRGSSKGSSASAGTSVTIGDIVCEAALWIDWENWGDLTAEEESMYLALSVVKFGEVMSQYWSACVLAVKYARACLNDTASQSCSDLTTFHHSLSELDMDEEKIVDKLYRHVLFISHYKQEAGTEAALMRIAMKDLISVNLECPVFVDSDDLTDLGRLQRHISKSDALVVVLTPGILTRPWCVLEIVTAFLHNVLVVPVEIQRPGMKYHYPDDEFYLRFGRGEVLDSEGPKLLESLGIDMNTAEDAIRSVFQKIAVPFSPHKSENIRNAEILDIMKRIPARCWQADNLVRASSRQEVGFGPSNTFRPRASVRQM